MRTGDLVLILSSAVLAILVVISNLVADGFAGVMFHMGQWISCFVVYTIGGYVILSGYRYLRSLFNPSPTPEVKA